MDCAGGGYKDYVRLVLGRKQENASFDGAACRYLFRIGWTQRYIVTECSPNKQGTVDADILARVAEFGKAVQNTFDKNLAEKASVSATEVRGNSKKYSPENLLDGNDETYWTVGDGTTSGKVLIDLGESKSSMLCR